MALYQVFLKGDITTGLEVSPEGVITSAVPMLKNSVGLPFRRVRRWVLSKGGEVFMVRDKDKNTGKAHFGSVREKSDI